MTIYLVGGIVAIPVTAGGSKGFVTDNSDFLNIAAALGRSCDVQHNQCANKVSLQFGSDVLRCTERHVHQANSGGQTFTVADCDAQDTACKAA